MRRASAAPVTTFAGVCLTLVAVQAWGQPASPTTTPANPATAPDELLRVSFIDVGQGDSIWIQVPKGADGKPGVNVLIDGGPSPASGEARLVDYLSKYGLKPGATIDCMIATHPHDDHYSGLLQVLNDYVVKRVIDTGFEKATKNQDGNLTPYGKFMAAVDKEAGVELKSLRKLKKLDLDWGPGVTAEIISGYFEGVQDLGSAQNTKENNASTVVRMQYGNVSFLLMGDAEGKERKDTPDTPAFVEGLLLKKFKDHPEKLAATVLKIAHHGSETSSTLPFMKAVHPEVVAVMSGRKKFGSVFLPDASVLSRYKKQFPKVTILRTDLNDSHRDTTDDADGDHIYMYSDGLSLRAFQAKRVNGKWRWVHQATVIPDDDGHPD